jgi:hypothetical protein
MKGTIEQISNVVPSSGKFSSVGICREGNRWELSPLNRLTVERSSMKANLRVPTAVLAGWAFLLAGQLVLAQDMSRTLALTVVKGQDGANDITTKTSAGIAILVTADGKPVTGAKVTVAFPPTGPSLTSSDGKPTAIGTTDASGMVIFADLKPNGSAGELDITATAVVGDRVGRVHVKQSNVNPVVAAAAVPSPPPASPAPSDTATKPQEAATPTPAAKTGKSHTALWIVIGVVAAAAIGGVVVASRTSKK